MIVLDWSPTPGELTRERVTYITAGAVSGTVLVMLFLGWVLYTARRAVRRQDERQKQQGLVALTQFLDQLVAEEERWKLAGSVYE